MSQTAEEFVKWLRGYLEGLGEIPLKPDHMERIREELEDVKVSGGRVEAVPRRHYRPPTIELLRAMRGVVIEGLPPGAWGMGAPPVRRNAAPPRGTGFP